MFKQTLAADEIANAMMHPHDWVAKVIDITTDDRQFEARLLLKEDFPLSRQKGDAKLWHVWDSSVHFSVGAPKRPLLVRPIQSCVVVPKLCCSKAIKSDKFPDWVLYSELLGRLLVPVHRGSSSSAALVNITPRLASRSNGIKDNSLGHSVSRKNTGLR